MNEIETLMKVWGPKVFFAQQQKIAFTTGERKREYWKECHYFVIGIIQSFMSLELYRNSWTQKMNHIIKNLCQVKMMELSFKCLHRRYLNEMLLICFICTYVICCLQEKGEREIQTSHFRFIRRVPDWTSDLINFLNLRLPK